RATAGLRFATTETRTVRQTELAADLGERRRRHERRAERGQLALGRIGEAPIQLLADDEIDDRVTEELEPLEVANAFPDVLVQIRAVRQRGREQLRVTEPVAGYLQVSHLLRHKRRGRGRNAPASPIALVRV